MGSVIDDPPSGVISIRIILNVFIPSKQCLLWVKRRYVGVWEDKAEFSLMLSGQQEFTYLMQIFITLYFFKKLTWWLDGCISDMLFCDCVMQL